MSGLQKVGIREFRNNIAKYTADTHPVAVMKHGQVVGYYLPAHSDRDCAELEGLKRAAQRLDELLLAQGVSEDELVSEFRTMREKDRAKSKVNKHGRGIRAEYRP